MEFIYTDMLVDVSAVTPELALDLIALSSQWMMNPLKALCEEIVCTGTSFKREEG